MEIHQLLKMLRRYWRSALAVVLLTIGAAAALTLLQTPSYSATSSVFLTVDSGDSAGELSQGATYAERTVTSYVNVARTEVVLQPVIDELGLGTTLEDLREALTISSPTGTSILNVTARDPSPVQAAEISNAAAGSLQRVVGELAPAGSDGDQLVRASVIDTAQPPDSPASPRPVLNLLLGAVLGCLLGLGQVVLRSKLDTRVRTREDVERVTDVPLLASVGRNVKTSIRSTGAASERWASGEAYRRLRTNIRFLSLDGERRRSILITSSVAGEGKTETAINLARVLAQAGESVLLVDADLRRPRIGQRMRIDAELGLVDVLTGHGTLDDFRIEVGTGRLSVLTSGTIPPNPSELLGSTAMAQLIAHAERDFDHIVFDTPPLLPVTDALVLASQTRGAIVVARSGHVRWSELGAALNNLSVGDVPALGIVLNDSPPEQTRAYGGYFASDRVN